MSVLLFPHKENGVDKLYPVIPLKKYANVPSSRGHELCKNSIPSYVETLYLNHYYHDLNHLVTPSLKYLIVNYVSTEAVNPLYNLRNTTVNIVMKCEYLELFYAKNINNLYSYVAFPNPHDINNVVGRLLSITTTQGYTPIGNMFKLRINDDDGVYCGLILCVKIQKKADKKSEVSKDIQIDEYVEPSELDYDITSMQKKLKKNKSKIEGLKLLTRAQKIIIGTQTELEKIKIDESKMLSECIDKIKELEIIIETHETTIKNQDTLLCEINNMINHV